MSPPENLVVKGGTTWVRNGRWILPENARLPLNIQGSFTCRKSTTWDKRLYFPSEGRRAEDFFASAGFESANLGTKGQHATSRPPKPLCMYVSMITASVACLWQQDAWTDESGGHKRLSFLTEMFLCVRKNAVSTVGIKRKCWEVWNWPKKEK